MAQNSPSDQVQAWMAAAKNKDADGISKLYTTDAVLCATEGIIKGQSNIKADFAAQFQAGWTLTDISNENDNVRTDWGWSYGNWSGTFPNPQPPPTTLDVQGSWSVVWVLQGGIWLMQQQSIITVPPQ